jgi:uncharacterized protein
VKRRNFVIGCAAAGAAVLTKLGFGCGPTEIEDSRRQLLTSWGQRFLLASYRDFEARSVELEARSNALCSAPSVEALEAARAAWWAARAPWKQSEVFAFGPYSDEPQRFGPKIDFWPARPDTVEEVLASTDPLTPETAAGMGAAGKGMPAIEYLLYQPGIDVVTAFSPGSRRCEYLLAITADLVVKAGELTAAWDPTQGNFLGELTQAGKSSARFKSLHDALGEVVNRMGYTLENIRGDKLGRPLGTTSGGAPQPDKVESPFSGRSLEDIRDNVRGIERLYFGEPARDEAGLEGYLVKRGKTFAKLMRAQLDATFAALDAVPEPLTEAIATSRDSVQAAIDQLGVLQRAIQVDVINALSLSVGFNDNDGD